jgi:hypothetical protein
MWVVSSGIVAVSCESGDDEIENFSRVGRVAGAGRSRVRRRRRAVTWGAPAMPLAQGTARRVTWDRRPVEQLEVEPPGLFVAA